MKNNVGKSILWFLLEPTLTYSCGFVHSMGTVMDSISLIELKEENGLTLVTGTFCPLLTIFLVLVKQGKN